MTVAGCNVTAVRCAADSTLKKTRLTPQTDYSVLALLTVTSTCGPYGKDERFEDGLSIERIKCTDVVSSGILSHQEYGCAGILRFFSPVINVLDFTDFFRFQLSVTCGKLSWRYLWLIYRHISHSFHTITDESSQTF